MSQCEYAEFSEEDHDFHQCENEPDYVGSSGEGDNIENMLSTGDWDWEVWFSNDEYFELCEEHRDKVQTALNQWRNYNYEQQEGDPF